MLDIHCYAQNSTNFKDEFEAFRKGIHSEYDDFRAEILRDYIDFLKNPWKSFESVPPVQKPKEEPAPPITVPEDKAKDLPVKSNPIVIEDVVKPTPVSPQPKPIVPIKENDNVDEITLEFNFFGTSCKVRYYSDKSYRVGKISENNVAKAFSVLATDKNDNLITDCLKTRNELQLCDWAFLLLIHKVAATACGDETNEATLLEAYLLLQSGYKIRLACSGEKLYVLYASKHCIYNKSSYFIDGDNYYCIDSLPSNLMVSRASFPSEQSISLQISKQPMFAQNLSVKRTAVSKAFPSISATFQINKNLMDFYETYPSSYYNDNFMTQWSQYANTPMASETATLLYERFRYLLTGLSEYESVAKILNWVQTGFEYEYDDKVWGHDRVFFAEESLYYPYCDCEDRSILFTRLVRDVLGLECILIYYPGHLACAVNFNSDVKGDYIMLSGKKFIVTDPTFIGAPIGMTMSGMDNKKATVILLD